MASKKKPMAASVRMPSLELLGQEHLAAIGCVAIEAAHLEELIEAILVDACALGVAAEEALWGRSQITTKLDAMNAVLAGKLRSQSRKDALASLHDRLRPAIRKRNTVIHGVWGADTSNHADWLFAALSGTRPKAAALKGADVVREGDILKIARGLAQLREELRAFYAPMARKRRPLPKRLAPQRRPRRVSRKVTQ
jgi:hypothetical protein